MILIIGAMAVSPDLLPITAIGVARGPSPSACRRGLLTLVLGLVGIGAAAAVRLRQDQLDLIPSGFWLSAVATELGGLATVSHETIVVALVAGIAGMLALDPCQLGGRRCGLGDDDSRRRLPRRGGGGRRAGGAVGALGVLGMNVLMMSVGASVTLTVHRALNRRAARSSRSASDAQPTLAAVPLGGLLRRQTHEVGLSAGLLDRHPPDTCWNVRVRSVRPLPRS